MKIALCILAVLLVMASMLFYVAHRDLKRRDICVSVGETWQYSVQLAGSIKDLAVSTIKYGFSFVGHPQKRQFDGIYTEYPAVGESFGKLQIPKSHVSILLVNEMSTTYSTE